MSWRGRSTTFTLRCTAPLLKRLRLPMEAQPSPPTTVLGDWTAHVIIMRRAHLVLCVAERTLLPVLVPGREMATLLPRSRAAVGEMLQAIGVPNDAAGRELDAMSEIVIGKTTSRRVLGSLNDFVRLAEPFLDGRSLLQVALRLAEAPCSPIDMESPRRATLAAFSTSRHAQ